MPTTVGILTFISMINTTYERLKARNFFICRYSNIYEQLKFCAQLSWAWKKFYNLGPEHFSFISITHGFFIWLIRNLIYTYFLQSCMSLLCFYRYDPVLCHLHLYTDVQLIFVWTLLHSYISCNINLYLTLVMLDIFMYIFSSPELKLSFCEWSLSGIHRPSVIFFFKRQSLVQI